MSMTGCDNNLPSMVSRTRPAVVLACATAVLVVTTTVRAFRAPQVAQQPATREVEFFESQIRPLLVESCFHCHTDDEKGGLRLDSRERMLKGGESGPAIVPGNPDASLLIRAVRHAEGAPKMPKDDPRLTDAQVAALAEWIRSGARWPAATSAPTAATAVSAPGKVITAEQRAFWSFQPIHQAAVPAVAHEDWPKSDVDRFILARLEKEGLSLARSADKLTLIRRATLDLTGLPPTFDEIDAFEKDSSPDAFAKVVD